METEKPLLTNILPRLADELRQLLTRQGYLDLTDHISSVRIHDKCRCGNDFCSSIYTALKPEGAWGGGYETIVLDPDEGMINVDIVDRTIVYVEVINRPDIKKAVDEAIK